MGGLTDLRTPAGADLRGMPVRQPGTASRRALLAGVGLLKIMHSIQAFRQFRSVRDIPEEFVAKRMNIFATVREARLVAGTSGSLTPVLSVEHVPLAKVPWSATSHSDLQIALAAVAVPSETILRSQAENVLSAKSGGRKVKIQLLEVSD